MAFWNILDQLEPDEREVALLMRDNASADYIFAAIARQMSDRYGDGPTSAEIQSAANRFVGVHLPKLRAASSRAFVGA